MLLKWVFPLPTMKKNTAVAGAVKISTFNAIFFKSTLFICPTGAGFTVVNNIYTSLFIKPHQYTSYTIITAPTTAAEGIYAKGLY